MQIIRVASRASSLAFLSFPFQICAQSASTSQKISCGYSNTTHALTFTTSSIPVASYCFDFAELFRGNATQGFVNQTKVLSSGAFGEAGIHWQLENVDTFDLQGNYTSVLYHQHIPNPASHDWKPGHYAERVAMIYGGTSCTEANPSGNKTLLPWYGFSCWSEDEGSCGTTPYKIGSFNLGSGVDKKNQHTCWMFAEEGAAPRVSTSFWSMLGILVGTYLAFWLAL
ncbi:hypothetical protein K491DRAFT_423715 [Lophiostoma macrostomum CBS 122681]|uniref:Uncharacterized protein n=1 Tax=Lophiostoma macrostomum CBS 122681 TaxID=1314788 RepID=A0A6A6TAI6_9PLEO|nr:hypothetical protein K491DRAFT_423715 [Lophiostoma macrostomum CBS 122681]